MIDIIKETMNVLTEDPELLGLLHDNPKAICRVLSPDINIKPRIALEIVSDEDPQSYSNKSRAYCASVRVLVVDDKSESLFPIGSRIDEVLQWHGCVRSGHSDRYDYHLDLFVKEMFYECRIMREGDEFIWLK